jgi:hypothetical protein
MIFPDDAVFRRVNEAKTGRVYVLEFKTSSKKMFFWMQEPSDAKDEEYAAQLKTYLTFYLFSPANIRPLSRRLCKKLNDGMNNPDAGDSEGLGGLEGGLGGLDQAQLMQMLGGSNPAALAQLQSVFGGLSNDSPVTSTPASPSPAAASTTASSAPAASGSASTSGNDLSTSLASALAGMLQNMPKKADGTEFFIIVTLIISALLMRFNDSLHSFKILS